MRMRKEIEALSGSVPLPSKLAPQFLVLLGRLRELVSENFGAAAGAGLEFDATNQVFIFVQEETMGKYNGAILTCREKFCIDPSKKIVAEFTRLEKDVAAFFEKITRLTEALREGNIHL